MRELHREPHSLARGFTFVETALKSRSCSGVVCEHEWFEDRSLGVVIAPILEYWLQLARTLELAGRSEPLRYCGPFILALPLRPMSNRLQEKSCIEGMPKFSHISIGRCLEDGLVKLPSFHSCILLFVSTKTLGFEKEDSQNSGL